MSPYARQTFECMIITSYRPFTNSNPKVPAASQGADNATIPALSTLTVPLEKDIHTMWCGTLRKPGPSSPVHSEEGQDAIMNGQQSKAGTLPRRSIRNSPLAASGSGPMLAGKSSMTADIRNGAGCLWSPVRLFQSPGTSNSRNTLSTGSTRAGVPTGG